MGCGSKPRSCGLDRLGDGRCLWRCARRSEPTHDPSYRRGLPPIDGKRDRQHGRFAANVIVFVLNNEGYLIERALEENPDWSYNDLAPWRYAELPRALGCADWLTARVATLGELEAAMKAARDSKSGAYIEVIGGRLDMPPILAFAHGRLENMYGDAP